jgi:hypothetical protein
MRNEEKLGSPIEPSSRSRNNPPPPTNNILSFPTPTEFVELPSGGLYYLKEHRLHGVDKIEIKMMTAKEEDILLNESYLRQGVAIDKLLQSVIVDKTIRLGDLLIGDKNALLFATRISGLGPEYRVKLSCAICNASDEENFDLASLGHKVISSDEEIVKTENGTFMITLPTTKLQIEFKILDGNSEKSLDETVKKRKKYKMPEDKLLYMMEMMVVSINGVDNRSQIKLCLEKIPASDCRYLRKSYEQVSPDMELGFDHTCSSCGITQEVTLPLTADFFWSK